MNSAATRRLAKGRKAHNEIKPGLFTAAGLSLLKEISIFAIQIHIVRLISWPEADGFGPYLFLRVRISAFSLDHESKFFRQVFHHPL